MRRKHPPACGCAGLSYRNQVWLLQFNLKASAWLWPSPTLCPTEIRGVAPVQLEGLCMVMTQSHALSAQSLSAPSPTKNKINSFLQNSYTLSGFQTELFVQFRWHSESCLGACSGRQLVPLVMPKGTAEVLECAHGQVLGEAFCTHPPLTPPSGPVRWVPSWLLLHRRNLTPEETAWVPQSQAGHKRQSWLGPPAVWSPHSCSRPSILSACRALVRGARGTADFIRGKWQGLWVSTGIWEWRVSSAV